MTHLLSKNFLGFYLAQSLGAFNDNFYRNSVILLITFAFAEQLGGFAGSMAGLSAAIFMLPFFIFSGTAGRLADSIDKARLVRILKWTELLIMIIAALGFWLMQLWLLLVALFLLGVQAAFFGPVKYSIIPQLVPKSSLMAGNASVEATTFIVILLGTIVSSLVMLDATHRIEVALACIGFSGLGVVASHWVAPQPTPAAREPWHWKIGRDIAHSISFGWRQRSLRYPLIGIAWFWGVGTVCLTQIPYYAASHLPNAAQVLPYLLGAFTLGIAVGAAICAMWQKGAINDKTVMVGAMGMALAALDFVWVSFHPLPDFPLRLTLDLFLLSASSGLIAVPLYSMMQHGAAVEVRGRVVASSNVVNALVMTIVSVISAAALSADTDVALTIMIWPLLTLPLLWLARKKWGE